MEKQEYIEREKGLRGGGLNKAILGFIFATSVVVSGILLKDHNFGDQSLSFKEDVVSNGDKIDSKKISAKTLSKEILDEYEKQKQGDNTEKFGNEVKKWVHSLLSKLGISYEEDENKEIDFYLLAKISKEYIDKHKVSIIGNNSGKAFLVAYFQDIKTRGEIVYLPIPPVNPENSTFKVNKSGILFSISPKNNSNGYNTEYNINTNIEGKTYQLSILYPVENPEISTSKKTKNKTKSYTYFSYIPYTKLQDTEKTRKIGISYLSQSMRLSYESVFGKKVSSYKSAVPGLSIGDAIPESFPLVLNIIERMGYFYYFEKDGITIRDQKSLSNIMGIQINKALTTLGLNGKDAFNWQKSDAGAIGIGQIKPSTYNLFREHEKYKPLFPEQDYSKAVREHETSFRLQVAHFDDQIFQLPKQIRDNWTKLLSSNSDRIGLNSILAAGYNGNMKRVVGEVFGNLPENPTIKDYQKALVPKNMMSRMRSVRDFKIRELENEISILLEKSKKKGIKKKEIDLINGKIKEKKDSIISINNTYRESVTYILKTEFVIEFLQSNYPEFMSKV